MGRSRLIKDKWQIIETAYGIIEEDGIENLSSRKLAKNLGISTMTLYNYVPNMAAIEKEVVLVGFNKLYRLILEQIQSGGEEMKKGGIRAFCRISAKARMNFALDHKEIYVLMYDPKKTSLKKDLELMPYYSYYNKISMVLRTDKEKRDSISKSISLFDFIINGIIVEMLQERERDGGREMSELIDHALDRLFT